MSGADVSSRSHAAGGSKFGLLSPELALVDPQLSRAARELLPDRVLGAPRRAEPVTPTTPAEPAPIDAPRERLGRQRADVGRRRNVPPVLVAAVVLTLLVAERQETPQAQRTASGTAGGTPALRAPETAPTQRATTTMARASAHTARLPPEQAPAGQTFVWAQVPGSSAYEFQLFRGQQRIFRARVTEPRVELPGRWQRGGRSQTLERGIHRWYVWPISRRTKRQADAAIVQARLVIEGESR